MWYNLDNIRGRLDDIYIIKIIERRREYGGRDKIFSM